MQAMLPLMSRHCKAGHPAVFTYRTDRIGIVTTIRTICTSGNRSLFDLYKVPCQRVSVIFTSKEVPDKQYVKVCAPNIHIFP